MKENRSIVMPENPRNIAGIYKYCDRWCERCLFTDRCQRYQGGEAAVSDAVYDADAEGVRNHPIVRAGDAYVDLVRAWFDAERRELLDRADELVARADCVDEASTLVTEAVQVKQALQIIAHDSSFIAPQLSRALRAHGRHVLGTPLTDPEQDDCDGLAKAALIVIDRSEAAWRILAEWMDGCATAVLLAETLADLRSRLELEFPAARQFIRPGFDRPSL